MHGICVSAILMARWMAEWQFWWLECTNDYWKLHGQIIRRQMPWLKYTLTLDFVQVIPEEKGEAWNICSIWKVQKITVQKLSTSNLCLSYIKNSLDFLLLFLTPWVWQWLEKVILKLRCKIVGSNKHWQPNLYRA